MPELNGRRTAEEMNDMVASRLASLRTDHGYTQAAIAEILDLKQAVYSHYEHGKRQVPLSVIVAAAERYSVSVNYLLGIAENKNEIPKIILDIQEVSKSLTADRQDKLLDYAKYLYKQQWEAKRGASQE